MSPPKLLLVEDDDDLRQMLSMLLEDEGYEVIEAENGREALSRLAERREVSVVLLDLLMPVMDGWETLAALRARPEWRSLPVVVCTSAPERAPSGVLVIPKPVDLPTLFAAIERARAGRGAP